MANSIPPLELGARGRELWAAIEGRDPAAVSTADVRRPVALEACRAADQLEHLAGIIHSEGMLSESSQGRSIHPAVTERDRLAPMMARLIVALRLPDAVTGAKPQGRNMRGVNMPPSVAGMSALDRARAAAAS